ncbi:glyceraldehyde-3-phosphate dehydrogenase-like [Cricetulus griseus]|uniref:Glyceraldehyde-3-phosphate dehydrogenase-like n=1 Tax=Cricetulus griseus TaxID=10029 RepID=A0A9J7K5Q0_CRIGR|nr:glyceraldehyde-3-phosphate dehydrogenase-like [Cricetulus griseus]XP_035317655.1 glyceraldehyde-3-phosphate dehydrogenase-like [Cricetulus griseus]
MRGEKTSPLSTIGLMELQEFEDDFTHSKFHGTVKAKKGKFIINGRAISILQNQDYSPNIKWGDAGTKHAVESTDAITTMEKSEPKWSREPKCHYLFTFYCPSMLVMGLNYKVRQ